MLYGVVWKYKDGDVVKRLVAHPESLEGIDTVAKAQEDGRSTLADLPTATQAQFSPLSVVELNENMIETLEQCDFEEVGELIFVQVDNLTLWSNKEWWSK